MRNKRWALIAWTLGATLIVSCNRARPRYPYGNRGCALVCLYHALVTYAHEHDGRFPTNQLVAGDALWALHPEYAVESVLTGLSGDRQRTTNGVLAGGIPPKMTTSWIYVPGLRIGMRPGLALYWESHSNLLPDGMFTPTNGHSVMFIDGSWRYIPQEDWENFLRSQMDLRELEGVPTDGVPVELVPKAR